MKIELTIDGVRHETDAHPGTTLMELLRDLGAVSVKNGCEHGDCGACAVLLNGRVVTSCLLFAAQVYGAQIRTAASLADDDGLHPLQSALLDTGSVQCGFCTPGILLTALELLDRNPMPSEDDVRQALMGNLCRCTGYVKIIEGVLLAAGRMEEGS
jgi:aerobic-type carbon monoxide dehydrogenase small subunit (CoxS/CutS family)